MAHTEAIHRTNGTVSVYLKKSVLKFIIIIIDIIFVITIIVIIDIIIIIIIVIIIIFFFAGTKIQFSASASGRGSTADS